MKDQISFFASCPKGLEQLLFTEIESLGGLQCRQTAAGVYFQADLKGLYKVCLWSRLANKVLMPLTEADSRNTDTIYRDVKQVAWEKHFSPDCTMAVDFIGSNRLIRNTQFGAQLVKDAIVDRIREQCGARPEIDRKTPDVRINARLTKGKVIVSLDMSGDSLHKRGYRKQPGGAPLKENLAAAILIRAGWLEIAQEGGSLLDPMCGSGTLLIEGALMALNIAPGLARATRHGVGFGFEYWNQHDDKTWREVIEEAKLAKRDDFVDEGCEIRGYDISNKAIGVSEANIERAGLDKLVRVSKKPMQEFVKPTHKEINPGLIICNPPYGERLGEVEALRADYLSLAQVMKKELPGWTLGVFTGNPELGKEMRLRPKKSYKLFNGTIASELLLFDLLSGDEAQLREGPSNREVIPEVNEQERIYTEEVLTEGAKMLANRLQKNLRKLRKWQKQQGMDCFRVYDADMPEYAAAIDFYQGDIHIQEYQAPKSIDADKAEKRFEEILQACSYVFNTAYGQLFVKTRKRNRGKEQYEKLETRRSETREVREGSAVFKINLTDYLDTGLFLDHRPLRLRIYQEAKGKQFLNLFCYTSTATVHAALGGATSSVSVDMSNTYLDWARDNYRLNNIHESRHKLIRGNCLDWLKQCRQGFDLIMLDPPSFSNSKKMEGVLDIQKDHAKLIQRCMDILNPGGTLYFSNNLRSFKLDEAISEKYTVNNISAETIDMDFKQNPKIHYCWQIQH
ncbi:bifunctional 23S rRNA (guanine(2069)-N(7))-methyltransferase RlmK/23S rRNA (guanine(2445)-N(2))-methyltransferase RlmL [Teredinibacter sp. KSP-S5-2]|uniref:bifunctional 23S rRNA (guanine(2069)-N(7))-methyltransferase RlmK/23S rRNA (guanine(2445)-N(2))-methyltransferase RlmL n=1 Tax=Teredinibacter sp. KSP-S5-2 TaxID=3034506 RepID=UPI002934F6DB|nr:bifunctional 23S rRNA (guanine(2069)-N(7))-methyltransferase RlmK/23S rRNA (guanine(2445)-N(2))-methyltransferase RlmL [Teredinibacter sp. KSP-S5-2]WNO07633.1 bifunctional 23S rRNA (guanine(2069)-N(7))-methyltransferase RlmK/23S rRNA (guanine(2445)-N(2))-methyltransferase RlmL [Teredinibacter sp. KSP-S5-2]